MPTNIQPISIRKTDHLPVNVQFNDTHKSLKTPNIFCSLALTQKLKYKLYFKKSDNSNFTFFFRRTNKTFLFLLIFLVVSFVQHCGIGPISRIFAAEFLYNTDSRKKADSSEAQKILNNRYLFEIPNKKVRLGFYPMTGYHIFDQNELVRGYGHDDLQQLWQFAPWTYNYSDPRRSWPDAIRIPEEGKTDLVTKVRKPPNREKKFAFSQLPTGLSSTILTDKGGNRRYRSGEHNNENGIPIGLMKNSCIEQTLIDFFRKKGFRRLAFYYENTNQFLSILPSEIKIHIYKTIQETVDFVLAEENAAVCLYINTAEAIARKDPFDRLESNLINGLQTEIAIGVRESRKPPLASIVCKSAASIGENFTNPARLTSRTIREKTNSFFLFIHQYSIPVLGIPCLILLFLCLFLWGLLRARKKEYLFGTVFGKAPFRYFIADAEGTLFQYNFGNDPGQLNLRSLNDIKDENIRRPLKELVEQTVRTGQTQEKIYTDSGRIRLLITSSLPKSLFGRPTVIGVSRDITELQEIHNQAKRNEEYFRLTLTGIGDGVIATNEKGNIILMNPAAERMTGVKMADAVGEPHTKLFRIISIEDQTDLDSPLIRTLRTDRPAELTVPASLISFDGSCRCPVACNSAPIHDEKGNIIGAILVLRDITEEYNRNKEIQEELANWEAVADIAQIYRFRYNPQNHKITEASKRLFEVWPIKDGIAVPASDWVCPEDLEKWYRSYYDIVEGRSKQCILEFRVHQNETARYFRGFIRKASDHNSDLTGLVQEITPFIKAQQKESAVKNLWTACVNAMPVTLFIKSADNKFSYKQCNQNFANLLGLRCEEVIGKTDAELFNRSEDAEYFRKCDQEVMAGGKILTFHETVQYPNGAIRHFMTVKVPVADMDGKPALLGMSLDETEDFDRRQKLRDMLEDWSIASNVAKIASYRLNNKWQIISKTDRIADLWPMKNGKPVPAEDYLVPEDVDLYNNMYQSVFSGEKEEASALYRIARPEGIRYIRIFIKKNADHPNEVSGIIQDLTEITLEQKKREALLTIWKNVIDSLPVMFIIKNADDNFRYLQANGNFSNHFGSKAEEIIGLEEKEFFPNPKDAKLIRENDLLTLKSGNRKDFIETLQDKDGILRHFQAVKLPSVNEAGQRIIITMALDITETLETSEVRRIISSAFETLFSSDDLTKDLREILKSICEFIGFDRAFIRFEDPDTDSLQLFTAYIPEGEDPIFDKESYRLENGSGLLPFYNKMAKSAHCEAVRIDFSNTQDLELAKYLVPAILGKVREFDLRGVHVNYVSSNNKIWGTLGFITQGRSMKFLSDNEKRLLNLTAHIVELAITRKRMLVRLENALRDALAAGKAKSFFLSSMSHEIRTPLNAVIGFTDLLKDSELDRETQMEYLDAVSESSHALLSLLNDILDLSKLTSGNVQSHPVLTNIQEFISEMDSLFRPEAKRKSLNLAFLASGIPTLYLDQPQLRQILFNLIGNAVKFTSKGEITVSLVFEKTNSNKGILTLKVSDTGPGIPLEDQDKLFEPFIQMTRMRGTNASGTGTGLGLAIVKKIVELEGGTLSLQSEIGQGSTFTVIWPNIKSKLPDTACLSSEDLSNSQEILSDGSNLSSDNLNGQRDQSNNQSGNQSDNQSDHSTADPLRITTNPDTPKINPVNSNLKPDASEIPKKPADLSANRTHFENKTDGSRIPVPRVLLVDDSEIVLNILERMLNWMKVPCRAVHSGKEALELLHSESFDLVLTDFLMPEMNGNSLASAIRTMPQGNEIRIVVMSTENESVMYDKSLFDHVMLKPIIRSALYDCLFNSANKPSDHKHGTA